MSTVLLFQKHRERRSGPSSSPQRLSDILANVAALLSQVESQEIQTTDDIHQAVLILEFANACIRLIVGQTRLSETARTTLRSRSKRIDFLIEATRKEAALLFERTDLTLRIADDGKQSKGAPCSV